MAVFFKKTNVSVLEQMLGKVSVLKYFLIEIDKKQKAIETLFSQAAAKLCRRTNVNRRAFTQPEHHFPLG